MATSSPFYLAADGRSEMKRPKLAYLGNWDREAAAYPWEHVSATDLCVPYKQGYLAIQQRFRIYWAEPLRTDAFVEAQLLLIAFTFGILDVITYPDAHCFASNQTGNTVLIAVGITGRNKGLFDLRNVCTSLLGFVTCALLTGQLGNVVGRRRRFWQFFMLLAQAGMICGAAFIQFRQAVGRDTTHWILAVLALLASASGSQVALSRAFDQPAIPTAMATAAWVDLLIDPRLFALNNRPKNLRGLFLIVIFAGSIAGAYMQVRIGSAWSLMITALGKVLSAAAILVSRGQPEAKIEQESGAK